MGSRLRIKPPEDYLFKRDVCSYGYFLLAPNRWDPESCTLTRPLLLDHSVAVLTIGQSKDAPGADLIVQSDIALDRAQQREARCRVERMLRLDEHDLSHFHRVDSRWKRSGRGRLFRSPTLFEDIVKTVTNCNVTWAGTMNMNARLCEVISPSFPSPRQLSRKRPATLRSRCGVGYRDERIVALAKLAVAGEIDEDWYADPSNSDEAVRERLLALPGIGPYAAANIMQLLGRYASLALDTESVRHGRDILGFEGESNDIMRRVTEHYERFGDQRFRSYWLDLWSFYEDRRGPAWTWDPATVGRTFTAALLTQRKRLATP
ncbi:MAG: hypothetical protein EA380_02420 [Phycisphaeraceae bacterium]|nr:MAG: hypothetical protein EA380_02420 [Phycisphaeraceae bacterium]